MKKKYLSVLLLMLIVLLSGCSSIDSKIINNESEETNDNAENNNQKYQELLEKNELYDDAEDLFELYNNINLNTVRSQVVIEDELGKSSNGVLLYRNSYVFYFMFDYDALKSVTKLTIYDCAKNSFEVDATVVSKIFLYKTNYDSETGFAMLRVDFSSNTAKVKDTIMTPVTFGTDEEEIISYVSSNKQPSKITFDTKIKTDSITYGDSTSQYTLYKSENDINPGTMLINSKAEVIGIYSSKLGAFVSTLLIKEICYTKFSILI